MVVGSLGRDTIAIYCSEILDGDLRASLPLSPISPRCRLAADGAVSILPPSQAQTTLARPTPSSRWAGMTPLLGRSVTVGPGGRVRARGRRGTRGLWLRYTTDRDRGVRRQ